MDSPLTPPLTQAADIFSASVSRLLAKLQEELLHQHVLALSNMTWTSSGWRRAVIPEGWPHGGGAGGHQLALNSELSDLAKYGQNSFFAPPLAVTAHGGGCDSPLDTFQSEEADQVSTPTECPVSAAEPRDGNGIKTQGGTTPREQKKTTLRLGSDLSAETPDSVSQRWLCIWPMLKEAEPNRNSVASDEDVGPPLDKGERFQKYFQKTKTVGITTYNSGGSTSRLKVMSGDVITGSSGRCFTHVAMLPNSPRRILWDVLSALVLAYDIAVVPLQTLFGTLLSEDMWVIGLATTIFWSLDMFLSLVTAHHSQGIVEMRFRKILRRYLRTWFLLDFLLVTLDWMLLAFEDGVGLIGAARSARMLRLARMLRVFRLLRVLKVQKLTSLVNLIRSENLLIWAGIGRLLVGIVLANHYIACAWYALAISGLRVRGDSLDSWVSVIEHREGQLSVLYWYLASLHWSLTQFTPASMDVTPRNSFERMFTIVVIIIALVAFSSVVSSITAAISALRSLNMQRHQQEELLRRYITEKRVTFQVGSRVYDHIKYRLRRESRPVHESDIEVLKKLPNMLQRQLRCDVYTPVLIVHPWFYYMDCVKDGVMEDICDVAMSECTVLPGSEVFTVGSPCSSMLFVVDGSIDYYYKSDMGKADKVLAGEFVCEAALWLQWLHRGRAMVPVNTELAVVDANGFRDAVARNKKMLRCASDHARSFARHHVLRYESHERISDLSSTVETEQAWAMASASFEAYAKITQAHSRLSSASGFTNTRNFIARVLHI